MTGPAWFRHELRLFCIALQFLTRLPVPAWVGYEPEYLSRCVRYFPLAGALVGTVGAVVALGALSLWPPVVAAALSVSATLWLTVAFHEDGLADTFDALLGAAPRERAFEIMKDSRIGSYGAAVLTLSLVLRIALLSALLQRDPWLAAAACIAAHTAGRATAVALMALLPYAGDEAHAKAKPLARGVRWTEALGGGLFGAVALAPAVALSPTPVAAVVHCGAGLGLVVLGLRAWLNRRLRGYTGDTLGACEQFGEITVLLALTATWPR